MVSDYTPLAVAKFRKASIFSLVTVKLRIEKHEGRAKMRVLCRMQHRAAALECQEHKTIEKMNKAAACLGPGNRSLSATVLS